jgi:hypothetical protein
MKKKPKALTQLSILLLLVAALMVCGGEEYHEAAIVVAIIGLIGLVVALIRGDLKLFGD